MKKKVTSNYNKVFSIIENIRSQPNDVILQLINQLAKDSVSETFKNIELSNFERVYFEKVALLEIINIFIEDYTELHREKENLERIIVEHTKTKNPKRKLIN